MVKPSRRRASGGKRNFLAHDAGTVGLEQRGVGGQRSTPGGRCEADELSPGDSEEKANRFRALALRDYAALRFRFSE